VGIGYGSRLTESILSSLYDAGSSLRGGSGSGRARSSDQQGMFECPSCGSVQTEAQDIDRGGEEGGFVCNACDHTWVL
jgi:hypothetical protein